MSRYPETYAAWKSDPEGFWADVAQEIDWSRPWDEVLETDGGGARWFKGATCNT